MDDVFELRLPASTRIARVRLVRSNRSSKMTLRIRQSGDICVVIPCGMRGNALEQARLFALKNLDWIDRQLEKFSKNASDTAGTTLLEYIKTHPSIFTGSVSSRIEISTTTARPFYVFRPHETVLPIYVREHFADEDLKNSLISLAKEILPAQLRELATRFDIPVEKISVRNQQSRWGSCTATGDISLNWRLLLLPQEIRNHVFLHELTHRLHMNHSDDFWEQLCARDPEAVKHDNLLKRDWIRLFNFR